MGDIECRYCHAVNDAEERRCVRCGRRLHLAHPQPAPDLYPSSSGTAAATAPAFETLRGGAPVPQMKPEAPPERGGYQPSLFPATSSKIIPIPTQAPARSGAQTGSHRRRGPRLPAAPRSPHLQQPLEFHDPGRQGLAMDLDVIVCDAPVAIPLHRVIAAAADGAAIVFALALFLLIFYLGGGQILLTRQTIPFVVGIGLVIGLFYRFIWALANCDTPGMRFAGLKLVDFDGRDPTREQRRVRQVASLLSLFSAGLGLLWAVVDEEHLTWHDHISKTFPTPSA